MGTTAPPSFHLHFVTGEAFPMSDLYVEVQSEAGQGIATREVGIDADGRVVHRMPSEVHRFGDYGIFDNAAVRFPLDAESSDVTASEFDALWRRPDVVPPPIEYRRLRGRLARIHQELRNAPPRLLTRAKDEIP